MISMVDETRPDIGNAFRLQIFSSPTAMVFWPSAHPEPGRLPPAREFEVFEPGSINEGLLHRIIGECREAGRFTPLAEGHVGRVYDGVAIALGASDWRDLVMSHTVRAAFMTRHPTRIYLFDEVFPGIDGDVPTVDHAPSYHPQKLPVGTTDAEAVSRFLDFFQSLPFDGQPSC
jgi:hypothetical protein